MPIPHLKRTCNPDSALLRWRLHKAFKESDCTRDEKLQVVCEVMAGMLAGYEPLHRLSIITEALNYTEDNALELGEMLDAQITAVN